MLPIRVICVSSTLSVIAFLAAIDHAYAACLPPSPVSNATVTCTNFTNGQNGTTGYGTNTDTGNTIVVQTSASVSGTLIGVTLQTGTVNNSGGIFGGASAANPPGIGIFGNNIIVTNSGFVTGGAKGTGITASTLDLRNSGNIASGNFGVLVSGTAIVDNIGTIAATANGTGLSANAAILTNAGTISGAIGVGANLPSSVFNSGTITGAGGTAIGFFSAGNTLTLTPSSVIVGTAHGFGTDTFQLGGAGTGALDAGLLATQYSGYGTFNKIGQSTWSLTGANSALLPWTVSGGVLRVNGAVENSTVTVDAGGVLGGNGIVGSTTISGGTLAPGNSIGLLTVRGSLLFTAASSYMVEVSPTNADRINVTGIATPGGATVNAVFLPGSFVNRQYVIVSATGGVNGTFNPTVVSNTANIQSTLTYDANDVFLNIKLIIPGLANGSLSVNQRNVANAITNFFDSTGSIPAAFAGLSATDLTAVSGELGTGVIQSSMKADDLFLRLLLDPSVVDVAGHISPFVNDRQSLNYSSDRRPVSVGREMTNMPLQTIPASADRWSVWGAAYGGSADVRGNAVYGSQNITARVYGVVSGATYRISPNSLFGFALAGGSTAFSPANGLGTGSTDLAQAALFGRANFGPAFVSAALAYGWHDVTTNRAVTFADFELLRGRFQAESFAGRLEGGYRFATSVVGITPYAAAQVISFGLPAYAEQTTVGAGTFALDYAAVATTEARSEFGLRGDKSFAVRNAVLRLGGQAAWVHDFNPDRAVTAGFQALPGATFVVNGARAKPDSALFNASAEMKWASGFSLRLGFESELSTNATSLSGKGVVRYTW